MFHSLGSTLDKSLQRINYNLPKEVRIVHVYYEDWFWSYDSNMSWPIPCSQIPLECIWCPHIFNNNTTFYRIHWFKKVSRSARGIYVKLTFDSINGYVDFVESILHSKTQLWYILVLKCIFHIAPSKLHHHT